MIKEATNSDVPAIQALMKDEPGFWPDSWRADAVERGLDAAAGLAFVSVENGEIVGFVCGHDLGFRAYLSELIVAKAHRQKGIGRDLVSHLEAQLAARGCDILFSDVWKNSTAFYESMGWSPPEVVLLRKKLNTKSSQPATAPYSEPAARSPQG